MCMLPKTAIWDYGLRGHDDLQIAEWPQMSKLTSDLKLLTSNTLISMCMLTKTALYCDGLRGQGNLNMTSEATSHNGFGKLYYYHFYLKFPICLLNMRNEKNFELPEVGLEPGTSWFKVQHPNHYATGLEAIVFLKFWGSIDWISFWPFMASEWPQRSHLASYLNSVASKPPNAMVLWPLNGLFHKFNQMGTDGQTRPPVDLLDAGKKHQDVYRDAPKGGPQVVWKWGEKVAASCLQ